MPTFPIFNNEPDVRSFPAGQVIFAEGQPDDDLMYAVLEGEVEIVRQQNRSASAVAKTDCRVAVITEKRFTRLVSQNPHLAFDLMRLLTERVRRNLAS